MEQACNGHSVMSMKKAGLYIHVPFCEKKCGYCDFYSVTNLALIDRFLDSLITEIRLISPAYKDWIFDTIYIGGGTPTLLNLQQIDRLWTAVFDHLSIVEEGEFSIEANPGTIDEENLSFLINLGINRLSLGAQSFQESDLRFLDRIHTLDDIYKNFEAAREAGFQNINIDLLTALPRLTQERYQKTLQEVISLHPEHISCYSLIFEPNTPFYKLLTQGELIALDSDEDANFHLFTKNFLEHRGYMAYEISNYAQNASVFCQHNLKYWAYQPYIGLGPSAHSFISPKRWSNVKSIKDYIDKLNQQILPLHNQEILKPEKLEFEYIFLHLRLKNGIDLHDYQKRFNEQFTKKYEKTVSHLMDSQMIQIMEDRISLTSKGRLLADEIASKF
jgi:oxygen-independent coproporphyrinogen-3 oxidase